MFDWLRFSPQLTSNLFNPIISFMILKTNTPFWPIKSIVYNSGRTSIWNFFWFNYKVYIQLSCFINIPNNEMSCTRIEWISVKSAYQGQWTWTVNEKGVQQTCNHDSWPRQMELLQIYRGVHSRSAVIAVITVITATSGVLFRNNVAREWSSQESPQLPRRFSLLSSVMRIEPVNYFNGFWVSVNFSSWLCDHTQDL